MNTNLNNACLIVICSFLLVLTYSCSSQKDTAATRRLQNLSARYNLIYNANVLLNEFEEGISQSRSENFNSLLPLYYAPTIANAATAGVKIKELDEIDEKARTIIAEKNFSNYIDEAYILLGKTNFYQGKYYNATAYFDYVAKTYKKDHNVYLNALNLKARSAIELNDIEIATNILDTVKLELDSVKKHKSEPLATLAQLSAIKKDNKQAIVYLERALKAKPSNLNKIRWTYALAQLYENEKEFEKSLAAYRKVEKSNASFEMYFNAKLSKIRINDQLAGKNFDRKLQLTRMLKDEKNADFKDQIYYEIAEDHLGSKEYAQAEANYNLSITNSTINKVQKALSYLKLAELNFENYNDYVTAKLYYDSTVLFLPKTHLLYAPIVNKAQNLAYLQERNETISLQDTLQKIALLPETERALALSNYLKVMEPVEVQSDESGDQPINANRAAPAFKPQGGGVFYFANAISIGKGFNEFKKRWGNRKLANNWRQSVKTGNQNQQDAADLVDAGLGVLPSDPDGVVPEVLNASSKSKLYLDSIPLTPALLEKSNQKIINAYLDMGSFYQHVLKDKPQTIKTYETLLMRFPNNGKLDVIYYSLYLAYQDINRTKSNMYKDLVLNKYSNSVFAKTILDPNFSIKQNQLEAVLNTEYESLFDKLQRKDFKTVITDATSVSQRFPGNVMEPQYDYLKAIAIGHTENVDRLIVAFKDITEKYKNDKLIKPLVEQHLIYINANLNYFKKRKVALTSYDANEISFSESNLTTVRMKEPIIANLQNPTGKEQIVAYVKPVVKKVEEKVVEKPAPKEVKKDSVVVKQRIVKTQIDSVIPKLALTKKDSVIIPLVVAKKDSVITAVVVKKDTIAKSVAVKKAVDTMDSPIVKPKPVKDDLFNPASSTNYYYVVAVNSVSVSVSSSRFGIGQFNRGNYAGTNLRHQLKELEKDQLVVVGDFNSVTEVQQYAENIKSQLGVIMKIPAANYTTFAISKENLNKIINHETLERYIRYINSNEL